MHAEQYTFYKNTHKSKYTHHVSENGCLKGKADGNGKQGQENRIVGMEREVKDWMMQKVRERSA